MAGAESTSWISSLFGSDSAPRPVWLAGAGQQAKDLAAFGREAIGSLRTGSQEASRRSAEGLARNDALMDQQAQIWQGLLNRPKMDPLGTYKGVGDTLFSYIKPNVLDPIARANVNRWRNDQRALGLNETVLDGTTRRLEDAANTNRVWLDVAKSIIPQINPGFNQVFNAGLASDQADVQRAGIIPQIIAAYQNNALAPLNPARAMAEAWNLGSAGLGNQGRNTKEVVTGYKTPQNLGDRLGAADENLWSRLGEAVNMVSSIYSGGLLGGGGGSGGSGGGGGLGGLMGGMGGGGGGGGGGGNNQMMQAIMALLNQYRGGGSGGGTGSFIPSSVAPPVGGYYGPGYGVSPYYG